MKYSVGDRFILNDIECIVAVVDVNGRAYLTPDYDEDLGMPGSLLKGVVFDYLDSKGKSLSGYKAIRVTINLDQSCQAV